VRRDFSFFSFAGLSAEISRHLRAGLTSVPCASTPVGNHRHARRETSRQSLVRIFSKAFFSPTRTRHSDILSAGVVFYHSYTLISSNFSPASCEKLKSPERCEAPEGRNQSRSVQTLLQELPRARNFLVAYFIYILPYM
jgi:hypothetical protein